MILTPPVLHLFGRQHGVAADVDLLHHISARQLKRAVADRILLPELRGVKRLTGAPIDVSSRVHALSLFVGDVGFVSGMAAARQLGVECVPLRYLELMITNRRDPDLPSWVKLTRSTWRLTEDRLSLADGRVVSSPLRTLFRCGATCSDARFEKIAEQMWNRKLITPLDAAVYLQLVRRRGRRGVTRFERWLEKAATRSRPSQSSLEVDVALAVVARGLPTPLRQHPLTLADGETIHIDVAWSHVKLGIEPGHTFWHSGSEKVRSDFARDRACDEVGWRILRFDEIELRDLQRCVSQIVTIFRQRQAALVSATNCTTNFGSSRTP